MINEAMVKTKKEHKMSGNVFRFNESNNYKVNLFDEKLVKLLKEENKNIKSIIINKDFKITNLSIELPRLDPNIVYKLYMKDLNFQIYDHIKRTSSDCAYFTLNLPVEFYEGDDTAYDIIIDWKINFKSRELSIESVSFLRNHGNPISIAHYRIKAALSGTVSVYIENILNDDTMDDDTDDEQVITLTQFLKILYHTKIEDLEIGFNFKKDKDSLMTISLSCDSENEETEKLISKILDKSNK